MGKKTPRKQSSTAKTLELLNENEKEIHTVKVKMNKKLSPSKKQELPSHPILGEITVNQPSSPRKKLLNHEAQHAQQQSHHADKENISPHSSPRKK